MYWICTGVISCCCPQLPHTTSPHGLFHQLWQHDLFGTQAFCPILGLHLDLGILYYVYMGLLAVFCTWPLSTCYLKSMGPCIRETSLCSCRCYTACAVLSPSPMGTSLSNSSVMSDSPNPLPFASQPPGFLTQVDLFWIKTASGLRPLPPFILLQILSSTFPFPCDYWHPGPFLPSNDYWLDFAYGFLQLATLPSPSHLCDLLRWDTVAFMQLPTTQGIYWAWGYRTQAPGWG